MPAELLLTWPGEVVLAPYDDARAGRATIHARGARERHQPRHRARALPRPVAVRRESGSTASCGSSSMTPEPDYPARLGYEWVGEVTAVGSAELGVAVGDRIQAALPHRETQIVDVDGPAVVAPAGRAPARAGRAAAVGDDRAAGRAGRGSSGRRSRGGVRPRRLRPDERRARAARRSLSGRRRRPGRGAARARDAARRRLDARPDATATSGRAQALRGPARSTSRSSSQAATTHCSRRCAASVSPAGWSPPDSTPARGADLRLGEEWHHNRLTLVSSMQGWGAPSRFSGLGPTRAPGGGAPAPRATAGSRPTALSHRFPFAAAADAYRCSRSGRPRRSAYCSSTTRRSGRRREAPRRRAGRPAPPRPPPSAASGPAKSSHARAIDPPTTTRSRRKAAHPRRQELAEVARRARGTPRAARCSPRGHARRRRRTSTRRGAVRGEDPAARDPSSTARRGTAADRGRRRAARRRRRGRCAPSAGTRRRARAERDAIARSCPARLPGPRLAERERLRVVQERRPRPARAGPRELAARSTPYSASSLPSPRSCRRRARSRTGPGAATPTRRQLARPPRPSSIAREQLLAARIGREADRVPTPRPCASRSTTPR